MKKYVQNTAKIMNVTRCQETVLKDVSPMNLWDKNVKTVLLGSLGIIATYHALLIVTIKHVKEQAVNVLTVVRAILQGDIVPIVFMGNMGADVI